MEEKKGMEEKTREEKKGKREEGRKKKGGVEEEREGGRKKKGEEEGRREGRGGRKKGEEEGRGGNRVSALCLARNFRSRSNQTMGCARTWMSGRAYESSLSMSRPVYRLRASVVQV